MPRPDGTLAGHAAGLPFEREAHKEFATAFPNRCFRHYESLNRILKAHPEVVEADQRMALLGPPALSLLLSRGKAQMRDWSPESEFEEKQNDTAENILFPDSRPTLESGGAVLIDVKTINLDRRGQPPNILSAGKLAQSLKLALESGRVPFDILYVAVAWRATASQLIAEEVRVKSLFRIAADLYINWVAAQQIQFHPLQVDQDFDGSREEWAKRFLTTFVRSLDSRINRQIDLRNRYQRVVDSSASIAAEEGSL